MGVGMLERECAGVWVFIQYFVCLAQLQCCCGFLFVLLRISASVSALQHIKVLDMYSCIEVAMYLKSGRQDCFKSCN